MTYVLFIDMVEVGDSNSPSPTKFYNENSRLRIVPGG
jgi:hypothetical protein